MPAMRFVQFADVHLDSHIGGAIDLPADKRSVVRQDIRTALSRACDLAREHRADLVLIPGDLFDHESLLPDASAFLVDTFRSISPIRVFITPGNHDSLRPGSPYLPRLGAQWPENVHVFTSSEFETIDLDDIGCSVTGIAHAHRGITDRLFAQSVNVGRLPISILLFHGSRDGYKPTEKATVIPFSDAELLAQGFTYAAVGHYHGLALVQDADGTVRAAYSGCLQGRGLDETGEKFAIVGEIDLDGRVVVDKVEVAPRRVICVEANVTGAADNAGVLARVDDSLSASCARECDLVNVLLSGILPLSATLDMSRLEPARNYFHVQVDGSRVQPEYDLEALSRESAASPLRSMFVRRILEMQDQAGEDERRMLQDALYYGLSALDGRKPEPRDAH